MSDSGNFKIMFYPTEPIIKIGAPPENKITINWELVKEQSDLFKTRLPQDRFNLVETTCYLLEHAKEIREDYEFYMQCSEETTADLFERLKNAPESNNFPDKGELGITSDVVRPKASIVPSAADAIPVLLTGRFKKAYIEHDQPEWLKRWNEVYAREMGDVQPQDSILHLYYNGETVCTVAADGTVVKAAADKIQAAKQSVLLRIENGEALTPSDYMIFLL